MIDTDNKTYVENYPDNVLKAKEEVMEKADPIELSIDDDKLVDILDKRIKASAQFFDKEYHLKERRKKNEDYLFGRQIAEKEKDYKNYETRYSDNATYEIEASIKPLAMSRLPDIIVTPGQEGNAEEEQTAKDLSIIVDSEPKKRNNRQVLGIAFKHHPVYFTGIIKVKWDAQYNDFCFEAVHPDYIEADHTCQTNNADDMNFIAQTLPITVQECFIRFPDKKDELKEELVKDIEFNSTDKIKDGKLTTKGLASQIKIKEIWFKWSEPKKDGEEGQYDQINGVIWKYKKCILKKIKNPNYDWDGEEKLVTYATPGDESTKKELTSEDMMNMAMSGMTPPNMTQEQVFKNYFEYPRFPFFFFGYDQWRKVYLDETSRIEQNLRNQEALNDAGKRIIDKLKQRRKDVFSKEGGLKASHLQQMDTEDPRQMLLLEGDLNKVYKGIEAETVGGDEFRFLDEARVRMYSLAGASAVRGEVQSDVATTNQIAREADYTRADDLVDETINSACEWMAQWTLQMIKLRYTDYHFRKFLGDKGKVTFMRLRGDMISDGMEVMIKASGTDKVKSKNQAMDMAKLQMIDPLSFFEDLGVSDPKGRVEKLMLFQTNPAEYLVRFAMNPNENPAQQMGGMLNGVPPQGQPALQPVVAPQPQQPTPGNTGKAPVEPSPVPSGSQSLL